MWVTRYANDCIVSFLFINTELVLSLMHVVLQQYGQMNSAAKQQETELLQEQWNAEMDIVKVEI